MNCANITIVPLKGSQIELRNEWGINIQGRQPKYEGSHKREDDSTNEDNHKKEDDP